MAKSYNGLNAYKIELAEIGICPQCGRRLSLCEHATEQQRTEWRIQDAELLEEIEKNGWYELPPVTTWKQAMEKRERDFNRRYYNNPDGKPEFKYG